MLKRLPLRRAPKKWLEFHQKLARLESEYQFYLFKFNILNLEFQAAYLTQKQDGEMIKKPQE